MATKISGNLDLKLPSKRTDTPGLCGSGQDRVVEEMGIGVVQIRKPFSRCVAWSATFTGHSDRELIEAGMINRGENCQRSNGDNKEVVGTTE
jgi:hypothetical protein